MKDTTRVSMTLTAEEYEALEARADKEQRQPTSLAKQLVMKGLDEQNAAALNAMSTLLGEALKLLRSVSDEAVGPQSIPGTPDFPAWSAPTFVVPLSVVESVRSFVTALDGQVESPADKQKDT